MFQVQGCRDFAPISSDAPPGSTRLGLRQVAGNAQGISQCAVVNRRWIQAPNGGQQQDFFRIGAAPLDLGEVILGVAFTVIVTSEAEFSFGPGLAPLVPQRFTGPRVAANGAAALEPRPGMVSRAPRWGARHGQLRIRRPAVLGGDAPVRVGPDDLVEGEAHLFFGLAVGTRAGLGLKRTPVALFSVVLLFTPLNMVAMDLLV